jgi:UDP-N-acetylmuramate--alanine ligase
MDPDHLDIYGDEAHIREAFKAFASQVSGTVIAKHGLDITPADTKARIMTYSYDDPSADFHAVLTDGDGTGFTHFDLHYPGGVIRDCVVGIPGWVNIENAVGAAAIGLTYGLDPEKIREALASFSGVKRRFDIQLKSDRCIYIDDYAHHPREISASLTSIRGNFPGYRMTAIFQPHLYTRTRDFAEGFAESLSCADRLILLDIYPAREEPIPGVTSEIIFKDVTSPEKVLLKKDELMGYLAGLEFSDKEVVVTVGAGDIDRFVEPIAELLNEKVL